MKYLFVIAALLSPATGLADEIQWQSDSVLMEDFDCDGSKDKAMLGYSNANVTIKLTLSGKTPESSLIFGLSDPERQDALCGGSAILTTFPASEKDILEMLGEVPEGYRSGDRCVNLKLSDGECDSINIYWNHNANELRWWRQ